MYSVPSTASRTTTLPSTASCKVTKGQSAMALYQKIYVTRIYICVESSWFYEKVHNLANFGGHAAILIQILLHLGIKVTCFVL